MQNKYYKKAMKIIRSVDQTTLVEIDNNNVWLVSATPQVITALQGKGFELALSCGKAQVLQPSCLRDSTLF